VPLPRQLAEHALSDVVVAAPVRRPFGEGELIHVVTAEPLGQLLGLIVDLFGRHAPAFAAVELDLGDLLLGGGVRDDGDERQTEKAREIGLRDGGAARGRLDDGGVLADPPVAHPIENQGPCQAMLQAAGRVRRLVLEIELDIPQARQLELDQMGVGRTVEVCLDHPDRLEHPIPVAGTQRTIHVRLVRRLWQRFLPLA
jgi:hypothetical protein